MFERFWEIYFIGKEIEMGFSNYQQIGILQVWSSFSGEKYAKFWKKIFVLSVFLNFFRSKENLALNDSTV